MTVYLVVVNVNYDGGQDVGVFSSYKKAREVLERYFAKHKEWREPIVIDSFIYKHTINPTELEYNSL